MKVIRKGKWKHFVECHTCEAELLLDAEDIKLHVGTQNAGDREFFFFVCPCCECDEEVPANDVPTDIRKTAYDAAHKPTPRPPALR
jgi:hypothetical protein